MKNINKKSFLIATLLTLANASADFTPPHGACPMPVGYEQPVIEETPKTSEKPSNLKKAAIVAVSLVVASAAAAGAMIVAHSYIEEGLMVTSY